MKTLKHPYLQIETEKDLTFGGNQAWFPYQFLKKSGCGVISAADTILYLRGRERISKAEYLDITKELWTRYLPVIPGFGMNGLSLMIGLNRYFRKKSLPYRACWMISGRKMQDRIDRMLAQDIPVILSIGPNFPVFWGNQKLNLYTKTAAGKFVPAVKTKAHYVNVTGREEKWIRISSWGKMYYIDTMEYQEYVKHFSSSLVSNILYMKKEGKKRKR